MAPLPSIIATFSVATIVKTILIMLKRILAMMTLATASVACAYPSISEIEPPPPVEIPVVEKSWKLPDGTHAEQYVLEQLQEHTKIRDRNALATIMGNIKSESNFIANICEGGARVTYENCTRGGYGLIQWTSLGRYNNLGKFCKRYSCDPSTLEGQTQYMINESVFQRHLPEFEGHGKTVDQYMVAAYYWLGWGIKGSRQLYAYDYTKKLVWA
jgi:hypothetical protein